MLVDSQMRNDVVSPYRFVTSLLKCSFEFLVAASSLSPVLTMKIISGGNVADLLHAIRRGGITEPTQIPRVGKEIGELIVLERPDKFTPVEASQPLCDPWAIGGSEDVLSALANLGIGVIRQNR
jgi:Holliday junction resolvasome RuvABC DNA-binding subunit